MTLEETGESKRGGKSHDYLFQSCFEQLRKSRVWILHKVFPFAVLSDLAIFQDHNLVDPFNGAQTMGDDNACPVVEQLLNRAINLLLGRWIQSRRGLVEDDDSRIFEKHAGKCK